MPSAIGRGCHKGRFDDKRYSVELGRADEAPPEPIATGASQSDRRDSRFLDMLQHPGFARLVCKVVLVTQAMRVQVGELVSRDERFRKPRRMPAAAVLRTRSLLDRVLRFGKDLFLEKEISR